MTNPKHYVTAEFLRTMSAYYDALANSPEGSRIPENLPDLIGHFDLQEPEATYHRMLLDRFGGTETDEHGVPFALYDSSIQKSKEPTPDHLALSERPYNALVRNQSISRIGYLVLRPESEILRIQNFGKRSHEQVRERLSALHPNLRLGMLTSYVHSHDIKDAKAHLSKKVKEQAPKLRDWYLGRNPNTTIEQYLRRSLTPDGLNALCEIHPALHPKNLELLTRD